jgi:hypothetical protein
MRSIPREVSLVTSRDQIPRIWSSLEHPLTGYLSQRVYICEIEAKEEFYAPAWNKNNIAYIYIYDNFQVPI